jgi:hypothetical protein
MKKVGNPGEISGYELIQLANAKSRGGIEDWL